MDRDTPVIAIDPGSQLRRLLEAPGGPRYRVAGSCEDLSLPSLTPKTVVVAPVSCVAGVRACCPAVKLLAVGDPLEALDCLRAGAFCFFSEPVVESSFRDVLEDAVDAGAWEDDLVLLSGTPDWVTLEVRCKIETIDRLIQWLRELERGMAHRDREDLLIAVRELVQNAIEHGGKADPAKTLRISRIRTDRARTYYIQDPGAGFSLKDIPHAAVSNDPDDPIHHTEVRSAHGMRPGGFGILLSRRLADELIYSEKGNEVLLVKYVPDTDRPI